MRLQPAGPTPAQIDTFASEGQCSRPQRETTMPCHSRRAARAILLLILPLGLGAQLPLANNSSAEVLRLRKPGAGAFTVPPLEFGERAGIFKRHGLDLEISAFTGG